MHTNLAADCFQLGRKVPRGGSKLMKRGGMEVSAGDVGRLPGRELVMSCISASDTDDDTGKEEIS